MIEPNIMLLLKFQAYCWKRNMARVAVRSEGEVVLLLTVAGVRHLHTFLSRGPGVPQCDHTSIMMDLTHHNTWTQHHLNINNNSNNILTLSVTGDTLGPLVLDQLKPAVSFRIDLRPEYYLLVYYVF